MTGSGSAAPATTSSVKPATTTWPPPVTPTPSLAAPATTRWWQRRDTTSNVYFFNPGYGQDKITGFEGANNDQIDLRGFGLANIAALQPYISQVGADTVITLNGADILTLTNINAGTLVADDFQFV